jgi:diamine N-acetyltransferase
MRQARPGDIPLLVELMREMYAELESPMEPADAARAFGELVDDPRLGRVFLIESGGDVAGYVAFTLGFTMQYAGRDAFIDDLYIRPAFRDRGLGGETLAALAVEAAAMGARAIHLEVADSNPRAKALYLRYGFEPHASRLLTRRLPGS